MYLVDTDILSTTGATGRREDVVTLEEGMDAHSGEPLLSTITVAEIGDGVVSAIPFHRVRDTTAARSHTSNSILASTIRML